MKKKVPKLIWIEGESKTIEIKSFGQVIDMNNCFAICEAGKVYVEFSEEEG